MRPEQERVKNLLIDTVTLLCKNSVQFKDELHVEGLLGVSVDKKDVFFVHISKEFTNSPSDGATVTHENTDSPGDVQAAEESIEVSENHNRHLSDSIRDDQQQIKTEVIEHSAGDDECLIVEDPKIKLEGIVSPAELIAGQRRAVKRTSQSGLMPTGSAQGDQYADDGSMTGAYGLGGDNLGNSQYGHLGEPPSKRRVDHHSDSSYLPQESEDPGGNPWPSIAGVSNFDPSQQQSFQQDSDNSQMSMPDGSQPGCSSWSTPGRGPSDSVKRGPSPEKVNDVGLEAGITPQKQALDLSVTAWAAQLPNSGGLFYGGVVGSGGPGLWDHLVSKCEDSRWKCLACGATFAAKQNAQLHIRRHTGEKPYACPICFKSFSRTSILKNHLKVHAKYGEFPKYSPKPEEQ